MNKLSVDNKVFLPQLVQLVNEGHLATIIAKGNSMRPFVEDGRDKLIFGQYDEIRVGDVVLAEVTEGHFVCHRVEKMEKGLITTRGDGNVTGTEIFEASNVRAKVVKIVRKDRTYDLATSKIWKCYSLIWPKLYPVRRYLLAIYRLLWHHQLPQRWSNR